MPPMPICPNCGEDNSDRARFCQACATPLTPEVYAQARVRKTITVVFADVSGSTAIGERFDPESVRSVMARYFSAARVALERHGGTVEKFIGDAVVAVFGIPILHEDDAIRAVRAAAEMRDALSHMNQELESEWGIGIAVRTGVNTGEVVAGDAATGGTLATGDAMNVAARFEQAAAPGEILIGERTYELVKDCASLEPVEPLTLKGKSDPVPAYRLLHVLPEARTHAVRFSAPMLGRDQELALLMQMFSDSVQSSTCRLVTVLGSAGVGKSRLVEETLELLDADAKVLRGRCLPYGEGITYWPVAEVVRQAAAIEGTDDNEGAVAKIAGLVAGEGHAGLIAGRVAAIAGLTEMAASAAETFWAIRKFLEVVARPQPLVVVIDDIHWAEPTLLDLIEHIAALSEGASLSLLCLARPELLEARATWSQGLTNATSVRLEPLAEAEAESLIEHHLGRAALGDEIRSRIMLAAGGNPLFVEEMLSMLIDGGWLRREDGRWIQVGDLSTLAIPPTISALLAARLDQLPAEERRVLEPASVVGQVFYRGAVAALAATEVGSRVDALLSALSGRDLIGPDTTPFAGEDAFRFRHILIRDAAYEAMPKHLRADLHEGFAAWLERAAGERVAEYEEILGYHLNRAYELRAELRLPTEEDRAIAVRAGELFASAGRRAFSRADMGAAVSLLTRASALLPQEHSARLQLQPDLGTALAEMGDLVEADAVFADAIRRAAAVGDPRLESRVRVDRLRFRVQTDPRAVMQQGLEEAEELVAASERLEDELGLADAWLLVAMFRFWLGRAGSAEAAGEEAAEHARRAGDHRMEARSLAWVGLALWYGPAPVSRGLEKLDDILRRADGHPEVEARVVCVRAHILAMLGRFDEARRTAQRGRRIYEELGLIVDMAGMVPLVGSFIERLAGDPAAAERQLMWGYEILDRMGEKGFLSSVAAALGEIVCILGRDEEAERFAEIGGEAASEDDVLTQILLRNARAKLLARRGALGEAEEVSRDAVRLAEATDWLDLHGDTLLGLAEVLGLMGRTEEATAATLEAADLFDRKGNAVSAGRANTLAKELAGRL